MAQRPKTIAEMDAEVMVGGPGIEEEPKAPPAEEIEEAAEIGQPEPSPEPWKADLAAMQARVDALHAENQQLRSAMVAPRQPAPQPEASPDFAELLFQDPNKALAMHAAQVERQVTAKLVQEFRAWEGRKEFWQGFFDKFPDLKPARELAGLVLQGNMQSLGPLPAAAAIDKLAALTRDRLQSYVPGKRSSKRATVEGAGTPLPRGNQVVEEQAPTLSDIIRGKRATRLHKAAAA